QCTIVNRYIAWVKSYRWDEEPETTNDEPIRIISDSQLPEIELTKFTKEGGPLTKKIFLFADGTLQKDGSACVMARGWAERVKVTSADAFGRLIKDLASSQAIALGALRPDLPDRVEVTTKRMLDGGGMRSRGPIIARTGTNIVYRGSAFVLLDYDSKGMPTTVATLLKQQGGFLGALMTLLPTLKDTAP